MSEVSKSVIMVLFSEGNELPSSDGSYLDSSSSSKVTPKDRRTLKLPSAAKLTPWEVTHESDEGMLGYVDCAIE